MRNNNIKIGILSLQGNFHTHSQCLEKIGIDSIFIDTPNKLKLVDGLIIPGGESGVLLKHFERNPLWIEKINDFNNQQKPILGTCAGIILLAKKVIPEQFSFGFLDISVIRNAYGRQLQSKNDMVTFSLDHQETSVMVSFIRQPKIDLINDKAIEIIACCQNEIVGVKKGHLLALTCHPEYTTTLLHQSFIKEVINQKSLRTA